MTCSVCKYVMDALDKDCPRCHGIAPKATVYTPSPKVVIPTPVKVVIPRCAKCGVVVSDTDIDCSGCGDPLRGAAAGTKRSTSSIVITPAPNSLNWVLGTLLAVGLAIGLFYFSSQYSNGPITNPGEDAPDLEIKMKTKSEWEQAILEKTNSDYAAKPPRRSYDRPVTCTEVSLVKEDENDVSIKYSGFLTLSDGDKRAIKLTIDKADGRGIWITEG